MASKYFLGQREGDPTPIGRLADFLDDAFQLAEGDIEATAIVEDFSGSGPANAGTKTLGHAASEVLGALVQDASGADVLLWKKASDFALSDDGLTLTNNAGDFNAAGDTFVVFTKPFLTRPTA